MSEQQESSVPVEQGIVFTGCLKPLDAGFSVAAVRDLRGRINDFELDFTSPVPYTRIIAAEFSQSLTDYRREVSFASFQDAAQHARLDMLDRHPDYMNVVNSAHAIAMATAAYETRGGANVKYKDVDNDNLRMATAAHFRRLEMPFLDGRLKVRADFSHAAPLCYESIEFKAFGQKETPVAALAAITLEAAAQVILSAEQTPAAQQKAISRLLRLPLPEETLCAIRAAEHMQSLVLPFELRCISGLMLRTKTSAIPTRVPDHAGWQDVSSAENTGRQLVQEWRDAADGRTTGMRVFVTPMGDMRARVWLDAFSELASCGLGIAPDYLEALDGRMSSRLIQHKDPARRALDFLGMTAASLNPRRTSPNGPGGMLKGGGIATLNFRK